MRMFFSLKNMYAFGICLHMGLPNTMLTPVFDPKHTGTKTNIYRYCYGVRKSRYQCGVPYWYGDACMHMVIFFAWVLTYIIFIFTFNDLHKKLYNNILQYSNLKFMHKIKP